MKITPIQVTIADLTKNYKDDGDSGMVRRVPLWAGNCSRYYHLRNK